MKKPQQCDELPYTSCGKRSTNKKPLYSMPVFKSKTHPLKNRDLIELIVIGIDPGKKGGIAVMYLEFDRTVNRVELHKMPETPTDINDFFKNLLHNYPFIRIVANFERVWGRPGSGSTAMFSFGRSYGHVEMCLLAHKIPFENPIPMKWQKEYGLVRDKTDNQSKWKNKLKEKAQQLFPKNKIILDTADALLIAEYGRRNLK